MMSKYSVSDAIGSAQVIKNKINALEIEMELVVKEQLLLMKAYSIVENKLRDMCSHNWNKTQSYQFAPLICNNCGIEKR